MKNKPRHEGDENVTEACDGRGHAEVDFGEDCGPAHKDRDHTQQSDPEMKVHKHADDKGDDALQVLNMKAALGKGALFEAEIRPGLEEVVQDKEDDDLESQAVFIHGILIADRCV